jgi:hypothetical protein
LTGKEKRRKEVAATFTWSIVQCDRVLSNGGITTAHWTCNAEDGTVLEVTQDIIMARMNAGELPE